MAREDLFDVSETHFEILHQPLIKYSHNDSLRTRHVRAHLVCGRENAPVFIQPPSPLPLPLHPPCPRFTSAPS